MPDESIGYYWNEAAKEREVAEQHDIEHAGDSTQYWQDCEICAERVNEEAAIDRMIETEIDIGKHPEL